MDFYWLIPVAPFALAGLAIWTRHQSKMVDKQMLLNQTRPTNDPDAERMREEMKYLKDRVATLEKIVTDERSSRELEHEIAKLKDS